MRTSHDQSRNINRRPRHTWQGWAAPHGATSFHLSPFPKSESYKDKACAVALVAAIVAMHSELHASSRSESCSSESHFIKDLRLVTSDKERPVP